jgi:hypothetical protein
MSNNRPNLTYIFSIIIVVLAAIASAAGLFIPDLYRDNALVVSALRGNDLVTLAVAVPTLIVALIVTGRGSLRALMVWMAMLGYMIYDYIFYLYGAAFNVIFLLYVALVGLSVYALIFGLSSIDAVEISRRFNPRTPVRWIGLFTLLLALLFGGMEISRALTFVVSGRLPHDVIATGHPTAVVYAVDLSLLVPGLVLAGGLLWFRRPWGYVLGTMFMIKGTSYGLALIAMSAFAAKATGSWDPLTPAYAAVAVGCLVACILLLGNMRPEERRRIHARWFGSAGAHRMS